MDISKKILLLLFIYSGLLSLLYLPFSPVYILGFHSAAINYWAFAISVLTLLFLSLYNIKIKESYYTAISLLITLFFIILNIFPIFAYISQKYPYIFQLIHVFAILFGILYVFIIIFKWWYKKNCKSD